MTASDAPAESQLYIWLDGEPATSDPDVTIPDLPGVSDIQLIVEALERGELGRYLPVTLHYAEHARPQRYRSLDVARLLRERHIRHRRRYEVIGVGEGRGITDGAR